MPIVPFSKSSAQSGSGPPRPAADPQWLQMAAAMMHSEGRLIAQSAQPYEMTPKDLEGKMDEFVDHYGAIHVPQSGEDVDAYVKKGGFESKPAPRGGTIIYKPSQTDKVS